MKTFQQLILATTIVYASQGLAATEELKETLQDKKHEIITNELLHNINTYCLTSTCRHGIIGGLN